MAHMWCFLNALVCVYVRVMVTHEEGESLKVRMHPYHYYDYFTYLIPLLIGFAVRTYMHAWHTRTRGHTDQFSGNMQSKWLYDDDHDDFKLTKPVRHTHMHIYIYVIAIPFANCLSDSFVRKKTKFKWSCNDNFRNDIQYPWMHVGVKLLGI